ncbi:MAG: Tm-1-like ATP-binding domain-containing protein [Hyphomicrobiales bacterium]|nr:Tm-1-like ATP-binding domain-containing protein [Hyphomicrobiales bacterium]
MGGRANVLLIGTADTKSPELLFLRDCILEAGGAAVFMDVGVLAGGAYAPEISNEEVAAAAGATLEGVKNSGDENSAMALMAEGAAIIAARLHAQGRIDGMLALGGTMGTDLALDVAAALPLGVPKCLVSTVAHSHLLPPERITPDLMTILWAGGLYGLNAICRSALAQAAGAVVGACRLARPPSGERPLVGMTSLGKSCLAYMETLLPALDRRGYEVAVFHTTGMGGRAFEALAAEGRFVAVMDFSLQELANHHAGSVVTAGPSRLEAAGKRGVPQIVAPGAVDMIDFPAWRPDEKASETRGFHAHNRLIASIAATADERRGVARLIASKLARAKGPTAYIMPLRGVEAWDRPGEPLHDAPALQAFIDEARACAAANIEFVELDAHINDAAFSEAALSIFDAWVSAGLVPKAERARA